MTKNFNVLDSNLNSETAKPIVHSVIYNFRKFFNNNFATSVSYNINEFGVSYIPVQNMFSGKFYFTLIPSIFKKLVQNALSDVY